MPRKHVYWIIVVTIISFFSVWCADPYAGTFRYVVRKIRANAIRPLSERELFDAGVSGMLCDIDENSSYIPPKTYSELNSEFHQEFGRSGILFYQDMATHRVRVGCTLPRSPARFVGILPGDELLSIDGIALENLAFREIFDKLNAPVGVESILEIVRPTTQKKMTFTIVSQKLPVESATGFVRCSDSTWNYYLPPFSGENDTKIMYIHLMTFGEKTPDEVAYLLRKGNADGATGLILDLSGNSGGLVDSACAICELLIPGRLPIVHTVNAQSELVATEYSTGGTQIWKKPIVVLMDNDSASASEIVAACLQDYGRKGMIQAICVGERTFGKGTIQSIFDMGPIPDDRRLSTETDPRTLWKKIWEKPSRGGFRISIAMYLSPMGRVIHRFKDSIDADEWGILPDAGWEVTWKDNPRRKANLKAFREELQAFDSLRVSGALPNNRWSEIYEYNYPLKRASEYFRGVKATPVTNQ